MTRDVFHDIENRGDTTLLDIISTMPWRVLELLSWLVDCLLWRLYLNKQANNQVEPMRLCLDDSLNVNAKDSESSARHGRRVALWIKYGICPLLRRTRSLERKILDHSGIVVLHGAAIDVAC